MNNEHSASFRFPVRPRRGFEWKHVGVTAFRHTRAEGGPRVWTILLRVGKKKQLLS